jgi:hypothetical protein
MCVCSELLSRALYGQYHPSPYDKGSQRVLQSGGGVRKDSPLHRALSMGRIPSTAVASRVSSLKSMVGLEVRLTCWSLRRTAAVIATLSSAGAL